MSPTFDELQREQAVAVAAALRREAGARGLALPAEQAARAGESVVGKDDPAARTAVRSLFGERAPLALVAFDTPGIQRYVFAVRRPIHIYGGSRIVADFTQATAPGSVQALLAELGMDEGSVIYAGGGGGLLLLPACRAGAVAERLRQALERATAGELHTAVAALDVWPDDLLAASDSQRRAGKSKALAALFGSRAEVPVTRYAETISALMALLARERSRAAALAGTLDGPENRRRCTACLENAAEAAGDGGPEGEERLCRACRRRAVSGAEGKRLGEQAKTFEDIVRDTPSDPYLAVVYVDGANVGGALEQLSSIAQYAVFSRAIEQAFTLALGDALAALPKPDQQRFQTPLRGGDDLLLVLPANAAFAFSAKFMESVEQSFSFAGNPLLAGAFRDAPPPLRRAVESFGVGVGVAIAKHHFPIRVLIDTARQLLKSAKSEIAGRGVRSAIDFMVLHSGTPLGDSVAAVRARWLSKPAMPRAGEPRIWLTRKPFSRAEFSAFLADVELLARTVPRSQIYQLRQAVEQGYAASCNFWKYQAARSGGKARERGWNRYLKDKGIMLGEVQDALWQSDPRTGDKRTWIVDAVEALRFVDVGGRA